ncbi:MAG: cell division ATP-binding protein FtsE [candidate division WS1 bacterium]|jgi:cell division transport system ATP-binding protein|nr:cell division ATP-binding protein FtsE [candidate division WS1 bacterium]
MIHMEGVGLVYRDGTRALRSIDLRIERGEFCFLVGASGSGKSSLLGLIYREFVPTEGRVVVAGQDVAALPRRMVPYLRRQVGVVFQDFRLLPDKTVWENVGFALDVLGASRKDKHYKVPISLELVGLSEKSDAFPHQLSGGEQQRVSIARALVNAPPILLADEPTGNLDPDVSWDITQLLGNIAERGTTVVVGTHDKFIVDRMHKRVVNLVQGAIVRDAKHGGSYDGT